MNSGSLKILIFLSALILSLKMYPQEDSAKIKTSIIIVNVKGIKSSKGLLKGYLFNSDTKFLKDVYKESVTSIIDFNNVQLVFEKVPFGTYAINIHHDINQNSLLDTNFLGIPKEPYGFSNNARGKRGPPSYNDSKIVVNTERIELTITIK